MPRDYVAPNRKPAPGPASLPGWVWLSAGLSMGLAIAALVYIGRPAEPMPMATPASARPPSAANKPAIEIKPAKDSEYSFYELLREQKVEVPREVDAPPATSPVPGVPAKPLSAAPAAETPARPPPANAAGRGAYMIVLGSFRAASNAEEHRASLALAGIESHIEKTRRASDGQTLYQVRVGPEATEAGAKARLARIQSQGFEGRILTLK